jgi:hypothetical protein
MSSDSELLLSSELESLFIQKERSSSLMKESVVNYWKSLME